VARGKKRELGNVFVSDRTLLSGAGLVTGGVWLSIQMFVCQSRCGLLFDKSVLPSGRNQSRSESSQTLTQIRASLSAWTDTQENLLYLLETNAHTLQPTSLLLLLKKVEAATSLADGL